MRLVLAGVGRLKAGPERELFDRYLKRAQALGRGLGFSPLDAVEVDEGQARSAAERQRAEAAALTSRLPAGAALIVLDERGRSPTSRDFADHLAAVRDRGEAALAVVVGGPDGFDPGFRARASLVFAFGAATLPHGLARVLAAEQVYRALTILAGHPYHRD